MRTGEHGFTAIELILVLVIVALLASIAAPNVSKSIQRATETALKENLYITRSALDDFYADVGRYPNTLEELVEKKYLRNLPLDPITDDRSSWQLSYSEEQGADQQGIMDIHSGADGESMEGQSYQEW